MLIGYGYNGESEYQDYARISKLFNLFVLSLSFSLSLSLSLCVCMCLSHPTDMYRCIS